jgi:hypothetical protein
MIHTEVIVATSIQEELKSQINSKYGIFENLFIIWFK